MKRLLCVIPHSPAFDSCFPLMERLQARGRVKPVILLGPRLRQVEPRAEAAIQAAGVECIRASYLRQELTSIIDILRADAVLTHSDPRAYAGKFRPRDTMLTALRKPVIFVQHGMVQMGLHYSGTKPRWDFHAGLMLVWTPLPDPEAPFFDPRVADRLVVTGLIKTNRLGPSPHREALDAALGRWRQRLLICHNYGFESPLYPAEKQREAFAEWARLAEERPDSLFILRGHRGRRHPENTRLEEDLIAGRPNIILSDRHAGLMRMATINDVLSAVDRVMTHPSSVVLDAIYDGKPVAVFDAVQPELACLPPAGTAAEIGAFLDEPNSLRHAAPLRALWRDRAQSRHRGRSTGKAHRGAVRGRKEARPRRGAGAVQMERSMLTNSTILVTGGTGSFGHAFVPMTLARYKPKKIIILSRDEMKQWEMAKLYGSDPRVRFFIGDVRDRERLYRALTGVDYVVHAAATKIVPTAEYNPFECVKTNVLGAMNLIDACIDKGVKRVVALSTDKASSPVNLYGATKLASDKLFVASNSYGGEHGCRFAVVRYGNVMGSRGSVIPFFLSIRDSGVLPITDPRMTRFMISLEEGVELVWHAFEDMEGGEIYVKKIPSMTITDIAQVVAPQARQDIIGIRPGEKLHEQMIGAEDAPHTYEYPEHFKILPAIHNWSASPGRIKDGVKVPDGFTYASDSNPQWMSREALAAWIETHRAKIGAI